MKEEDRCIVTFWSETHKFRPRYSYTSPEWLNNLKSFKTSETNIQKYYEKHYICDVCERCGKIVNNQ